MWLQHRVVLVGRLLQKVARVLGAVLRLELLLEGGALLHVLVLLALLIHLLQEVVHLLRVRV